jgi:hypothetical protein
MSGARALACAREYVVELTGEESEGISGLTRSNGNWKVVLDLVELRRVPRSTDVMATYELEIDGRGDLVGYRRLHRYFRNQVDRG